MVAIAKIAGVKMCQALRRDTLRGLAEFIVSVIDYRGKLVFASSKPDGTPCKERCYRWFKEHFEEARL